MVGRLEHSYLDATKSVVLLYSAAFEYSEEWPLVSTRLYYRAQDR